MLYNEIPLAGKAAVVTMVQVTPAQSRNHRDGAYTAVQKLNADNDGKGVAIGFKQDYYVSLNR